ncbi:hypothetical protein POTOM_061200 [Populus tomentosa]|uniref:PHD-type domain-containing protein n=1 Tax=Populus tomentosa TaxID=118781 RepID=A0A8X8BYI2_POPTO|nr:hypothetical protein POTOM_061200 [Populus tomentosa]
MAFHVACPITWLVLLLSSLLLTLYTPSVSLISPLFCLSRERVLIFFLGLIRYRVCFVSLSLAVAELVFCPLGFTRDLHSTKSKADYLFDLARIDEFLKDPFGIRASREGTVQVSVPKVVPVPVPVQIHPPQSLAVIRGEIEEVIGGVGVVVEEAVSPQAKRVAIQRQAAAAKASAEYYAKKVESGDTAVTSKDISEEDASPLCRMCFVGENRGSERARKMLPCKSCGKKYHRSCLKTWAQHRGKTHWIYFTGVRGTARLAELVRVLIDMHHRLIKSMALYFFWARNLDKYVEEPETQISLCFAKGVDGAYHCYCQHPPHKNVSSGPYLCIKHTKCHSCGSTVPGNGLSVRWFLGYTCCDACGRLFVKGNYCPVCLKVYRDSESTPMVCCDICQRWVHCHCDGISDEKYLQFQVDGNLQYQCATCRGECYQVKDLEDAVQELWRRRDKADRDDDENGPAAPRNDFGRSIKLSLKGLVEKSPKKSKDHGKKHLNKKYPKRKGPHAASFSKTESYQHESHSYEHDSGDEKNNDTESQAKGGLGRCSSPVAGIVSHTEGICSINQPGALKQQVLGDDAEKPSKSKSVKAKKLVINLGARKINVSSSPKSDAQSCQREQDLKASNGDGVDHSEQKRGLIKFARREGNFIKFGKVKAEASDLNLKSDGGNHFDAYETTPLDHARVTSSKRSLEGSRAAVGPAGEVPMLRNDRVSLGKQSEARLDTHTESNDDSGDTPILHSLPKDSKLSLKLKIKKPNLENQSSQILLHEEEKSNTRGQRSKGREHQPSWIKQYAIGKRVEVHQPSDNSWHKGVVSDIVEGTSLLSITLDDGRVKTLELGKQAVRFVPQKQKRSKT